jgi:Family of unknown function (DUF5681)
MPFVTGQSGNPAGRPVGSRNKVNRAMDPVFTANGEAIIERVVEHAKAANPVAMRLCMDRLVPGGKHRLLRFQLPPMKTGEDVYAAITIIHDALGDGDISTSDATELLRVAQFTLRLLREVDDEAREVEDRLERVEEAVTKCLTLLGAAPEPGSNSEAPTPPPQPSDPAAGEGAIVNNNAETMAPASAEPSSAAVASAEPAPDAGNNEDPIAAAALDAAVQAALADVRPRRRSTRARLMESVSPLALMVGLTPAKTTPLILPDLPLASAA